MLKMLNWDQKDKSNIFLKKLSRMMKMKTSETGKEKQKRPTGGYKRRRRK